MERIPNERTTFGYDPNGTGTRTTHDLARRILTIEHTQGGTGEHLRLRV